VRFSVLLQIRRLREALAAFVAFEWLVASVNAHVRRQVKIERKAALAVRERTFEGTLASVDQLMTFQLKNGFKNMIDRNYNNFFRASYFGAHFEKVRV